jgi:hypothetical protein
MFPEINVNSNGIGGSGKTAEEMFAYADPPVTGVEE